MSPPHEVSISIHSFLEKSRPRTVESKDPWAERQGVFARNKILDIEIIN